MIRKTRKTGFTLVEGLILLFCIAMCLSLSFVGMERVTVFIKMRSACMSMEQLFTNARIDSMYNQQTHSIIIDTVRDRVFVDGIEQIQIHASFLPGTFKQDIIEIKSLSSGAFSKAGSIFMVFDQSEKSLVIPIGLSAVYVR